MKTCSKCKNVWSLDMFYKKKQSKDGYDFWCKNCYKSVRPKRATTYSMKSPHFKARDIGELVNNARRRANIKGLDYTLETKVISEMVHNFCEHNKYSFKPKDPFKPSIDRIDSSKGYTHDNVRIIWLIENYCKNTFSEDQVIEFCKLKLSAARSGL